MRVVPRGRRSEGAWACELADAYGLTPDPHQVEVLKAWLQIRPDERWAASVTGLVEPRQNGKNACIEIRELYGTTILGERFLHTAHQVKTAEKAFQRILSFFQDPESDLASMLVEVKRQLGQQTIVLTTGGSIEFIARSRNSGRGFAGIDVLVCDEAQDLTDEEQAALLPTISAASLGNPQVIFTGTPPDPEIGQTGEVFVRVRQQAVEGRDPRLCWIEYGMPDGPCPDVTDRRLWTQTNPALGTGRLQIEEVERELALMSAEAFARERLGWWGEPLSGLDPFGGKWPGCVGVRPRGLAPDALAVAVSWDQSSSAIGSAAFHDGIVYVKPLHHGRGKAWVVARVKQEQDRHGVDVVVDKRGPAADLIDELEAAGVYLKIVDTPEVLDGCATLYDLVTEGRVRHESGHELDLALDAAVAGAVKRPVADRWAWGRRKSTVDVSPLEAVTLAAHEAAKPSLLPMIF